MTQIGPYGVSIDGGQTDSDPASYAARAEGEPSVVPDTQDDQSRTRDVFGRLAARVAAACNKLLTVITGYSDLLLGFS